MRIVKFDNYDEMSAFVADLIASQLKLKPEIDEAIAAKKAAEAEANK